jgi:competence protein ComEA
MPNGHTHSINTPFEFEPYLSGAKIAVSGCVSFDDPAAYTQTPKDIIVELLDSGRKRLVRLDYPNSVYYKSYPQAIHPGYPSMFAATLEAPKGDGEFWIRTTFYPRTGDPSVQEERIFIYQNNSPNRAPRRAPDQPGPLKISFVEPPPNDRYPSGARVDVVGKTKVYRESAYIYMLLVNDQSNLIVGAAIVLDWEAQASGNQFRTSLAPLAVGSAAPVQHSIVAYAIAKNRGQIIESKSLTILVEDPASSRGVSIQPRSVEARANNVPRKIALNTANEEELTSLPGIGPKLAAKILYARPFETLEGITVVPGIGPKTYERIKQIVKLR